MGYHRYKGFLEFIKPFGCFQISYIPNQILPFKEVGYMGCESLSQANLFFCINRTTESYEYQDTTGYPLDFDRQPKNKGLVQTIKMRRERTFREKSVLRF